MKCFCDRMLKRYNLELVLCHLVWYVLTLVDPFTEVPFLIGNFTSVYSHYIFPYILGEFASPVNDVFLAFSQFSALLSLLLEVLGNPWSFSDI